MNRPEHPQPEVAGPSLYEEYPQYSHIVGVFRDQSQAAQALEDLRLAGIEEDHMQFGEYHPATSESNLPIADEVNALGLHDTGKRFLVHVQAPGRELEVVGILAQHGANNADVPPGTELIQGSLVRTHTPDEVVEHILK